MGTGATGREVAVGFVGGGVGVAESVVGGLASDGIVGAVLGASAGTDGGGTFAAGVVAAGRGAAGGFSGGGVGVAEGVAG